MMNSLRIYRVLLTLGVVLPLIGVLVAIYLCWNQYVFWSDIQLLLVFYVLTGAGIGIGYHRMLTHEGFQTYWPIRAFFVILGAMAFEGTPLSWAATHIKHHAHSDEEHDPHSPLEGFWHAHMGWLYSLKNFGEAKKFVPQLLEDRVICFISRYTFVWMALSLLIPFALGGWTGLLWGGLVRIFLVHHVTWSVNSVCHTFGKRAFETTDESRNEWLVGLLAFGEGWHNNHHAFPRNAFHGLSWYQFDLNGIIIRLLEKTGLVWSVQRVSEEIQQAHRAKPSQQAIAVDLRTQLQQAIDGADSELQALIAHGIESAMTTVHDGKRRLHEIRVFVARAGNLKRQKLMLYMAEVQQIVSRAKEEVQRRAMNVAS